MHTNIKMPNFYTLVKVIYSWLSIMKKINLPLKINTLTFRDLSSCIIALKNLEYECSYEVAGN